MAFVQIARNATIAKLHNPAKEVVNFVNNLLSYQVEGGMGWSGKSSFLELSTMTFPAGFTYTVQEELQKVGHFVQIIQAALPAPLGPENPIVDDFGNDDPRYDYQLTTLRQVEKHGAGIVRIATGGGKSKVAKLIIRRYNRMTLFLTTRGILLYQMKHQLDANGTETGVIGDGQMHFVREVNLGMVQTLVQALEETTLDREIRAVVKSIHLSKNKNENMSREEIVKIATEVFEKKKKRRDAIIRFLSMIEVVIGEEAHEAGGTSYYEILKYCKNARIRIALTATPFMRTSAEDNMRLMAAFGPVLVDVSEEMLINRGILAKPFFRFVDSEPSKGLHKTSPWERAYKLGYIENDNMMRDALRDALRAKQCGLPVLALILRKEHGKAVEEIYRKNGINAVFLKGADDQKAREKCLSDLAAGRIDCIIGTTILDVGVDCPSIGLVQLLGGGKAEVALRQRIGRGLRSKRSGPNITFVADYSCNMNAALREHAKQRENIIRRTPGFVEGIIETGDFPWEMFEKALDER